MGLRRKCREGWRRGSEVHVGKDGIGARKDMRRKTEKGLGRTCRKRTEKGLGRKCREGWRRGSEGNVEKDEEGARKKM